MDINKVADNEVSLYDETVDFTQIGAILKPALAVLRYLISNSWFGIP